MAVDLLADEYGSPQTPSAPRDLLADEYPSSTMDKVTSFLNTFTPIGPQGLAGTAEGIERFGQAVANLPHDVTGLGSSIIPDIYHIPGADPTSLAYKSGNFGGQYIAPTVATAGLNRAIPAIEAASPIVQNALTGGLTGFAGNNGDLLSRLGSGGVGVGLGVVGSAIKPAVNFLTGNNVQTAAENIYNDVVQGKPTDILNKENIQNIQNNYNSIKGAISQGYSDVMDAAERRGYLSGDNGSYKVILPSSDTQQSFQSILNPDEAGESFSIPSKVTKSIDNFNDNPSFENAHDLQSLLGSESSRFYRYGDPTSYDASQALRDARDNLIGDIHSTFNANGDADLGQSYQDLSNQWRDNVIPYQRVPQIWNFLGKNKLMPKNVLNVLSNDNLLGDVSKINSDLGQNPQMANNVLAQQLSTSADSEGVDSKDLIKNYLEMPSMLKQFTSPQTAQNMNALNQLSNRFSYLKKGVVGTGGVAALTGGLHWLFSPHESNANPMNQDQGDYQNG